jgi:superkiller protein 3
MANFQKALELDPALASAHDHLGNALFQEGQVEAAIDQLQEAVKISPYLLTANFNLGNAFLQQQRLDDAIAQYRKVIELDPNFAEALSNLGLALAQNGQLGEAILDLQPGPGARTKRGDERRPGAIPGGGALKTGLPGGPK